MKIDLMNLPLQHLEHFNGGEKELAAHMYKDGKLKILYGTLVPGASIGLHTHTTSLEVIHLVKGTAVATCDGVEEVLTAGDVHYCPNGIAHKLENRSQENVEFFAVVPEV